MSRSLRLRKSICCSILFCLPVAAAWAINFTPRYAESVQDGFPIKRLYFSDQAQRIYLSTPNGWRVTGDSQRAKFTSDKFSQAAVILENSPFKLAFEGEDLKAYQKAARELLPAGASDVQVDFERTNEIQVNGWSSFEMSFTYTLYGQAFTSSVLFINLDKEKQIRLRVHARKDDFPKLYPQARSSLGSWFAPSPELEAVLERVGSKM